MFVVTIETDNDAFAQDCGVEIARILHNLADRVAENMIGPNDRHIYQLHDLNGLNVGEAKSTKSIMWTESNESVGWQIEPIDPNEDIDGRVDEDPEYGHNDGGFHEEPHAY